MQKLGCILLKSVVLVPSFPAPKDKIRVGYIDYHPIVSRNSREPRGLFIDYVRDIFRDAGLSPQWQEVSVTRGIHQLEQSQLDILLMLLKSPDRERTLKFSSTPLFQAKPAVCGKRGRINFPLKTRLRMAHSLATVMPYVLRQHQPVAVAPDHITERMLSMLEKDRIDAFFYVNPEILALFHTRMSASYDVECLILRDASMQVYMAYPKGISPELESALNLSLVWHGSRRSFDDFLQDKLSDFDSSRLSFRNADSKSFELKSSHPGNP